MTAMEKRRLSYRARTAVFLAAAGIAGGCAKLAGNGLEPAQEQDLAAYVEAYHLCVAHTASRLDDGKSAIVAISAQALGYCEPEVRGVAAYLDSTKLSASAKAQYVDNLIHSATTKSEVMLRRLRDRQSGVTGI